MQPGIHRTLVLLFLALAALVTPALQRALTEHDREVRLYATEALDRLPPRLVCT